MLVALAPGISARLPARPGIERAGRPHGPLAAAGQQGTHGVIGGRKSASIAL
jgi:hypothetical protein